MSEYNTEAAKEQAAIYMAALQKDVDMMVELKTGQRSMQRFFERVTLALKIWHATVTKIPATLTPVDECDIDSIPSGKPEGNTR